MDKKSELGSLGEKYATYYLKRRGCEVQPSENRYDMEKDMLVKFPGSTDWLKAEVKTQTPYFLKKAFTIDSKHANQLPKCLSVDLLYWVEMASKYNGDVMRLWEHPKDKRRYQTETTRDGRVMHLFNIDDCNLLKTCTNRDIINLFNSHSSSAWI